jgi:formylglycine-generating enzyme required for sulfatase activity
MDMFTHYVMRGGSWAGSPRYARCSFRTSDHPNGRLGSLGVRVVIRNKKRKK